MKTALLVAFLAVCAPAFGALQFLSIKPSVKSPQTVGTAVTWTVTATDSNPGPLTFQFSVAPSGAPQVLARDFNTGTLSAGTWTSRPFVWVPTGPEATYNIQVVMKDFGSGESAVKYVQFSITPLVTGTTPVVVGTTNPLVALFSAPSCATGSSMRVHFQPQAGGAVGLTNWVTCVPPKTMTFEVAGMYPSTAYQLYAQTVTLGKVTNGPPVTFTTGALPSNITFPKFTVQVPAGPQTDTIDSIILHNMIQLGGGLRYPDVASDLAGKIMWYYYSIDPTKPSPSIGIHTLSRLLPGGTILTQENGFAWNQISQVGQYLRQVDLAGNIVKETNTGAVQQQLKALGSVDGGPCNFPSPAPIGSACLGSFHHDAIVLPNGYTAAIASVEKIFPPGTQGDTSGLPVDVIGDMILVLNTNWQVVWYFDTFQHDGGAPQLDISRPAVLGETCIVNQQGCPPVYLLGTGIAPKATDWLHANSLYYWPKDGSIIWSSRHQDWIMKVDYNNGSGTGNILWRMGRNGDFTFNNIFNDSWPWFSHQHDAGIENSGNGVMTIFDNANTRVSAPPLGLGSGNSRGMAVNLNENTMQVTPVLNADMGVFGLAMGSAQLLSNGNYFFEPPYVVLGLNSIAAYSIEILPTAGTGTGTQVLNMAGQQQYRAFRIPNLYTPPTT
ncbi:MAG: aryl-sulfate sulfotransferase [Bryobacteraceae bacterium]